MIRTEISISAGVGPCDAPVLVVMSLQEDGYVEEIDQLYLITKTRCTE